MPRFRAQAAAAAKKRSPAGRCNANRPGAGRERRSNDVARLSARRRRSYKATRSQNQRRPESPAFGPHRAACSDCSRSDCRRGRTMIARVRRCRRFAPLVRDARWSRGRRNGRATAAGRAPGCPTSFRRTRHNKKPEPVCGFGRRQWARRPRQTGAASRSARSGDTVHVDSSHSPSAM